MKKVFVPILLVFISLAFKADEWKTITLMDKVTITLPGTPKEDNSKGVPIQNVTMTDSTEFNIITVDMSAFGMTEEMVQQMAVSDQAKQQIEAQVANQKGVKIVKNEMGKYNDKYTSYEIVADVDRDGYKGTVTSRTVFYKASQITLMYKPGKKGEDAALRDKVFNSLKIAD